MTKNDTNQIFRAFRIGLIVMFIPILFVAFMPFIVRGQVVGESFDTSATSTIEDLIVATSTQDILETATTSDNLISSEISTTTEIVSETINEPADEAVEEVSSEDSDNMAAIGVLEDLITETESVDESKHEAELELVPLEDVLDYLPQVERLSSRVFSNKVVVDESATHMCELKKFRIDVSGKTESFGSVILKSSPDEKHKDDLYQLEIGGLPNGIDMQFTEGRGYFYEFYEGEGSVDFKINNQNGSRKGDFSVPIIYTRKDKVDSSVICQVNIVNI